jgi:hypothetical protein
LKSNSRSKGSNANNSNNANANGLRRQSSLSNVSALDYNGIRNSTHIYILNRGVYV